MKIENWKLKNFSMFFKKFCLSLIRFYQSLPLASHTACRFIPTCSEYSYQMIEAHGAWKGIWLGLRQVIHCHPFNSKLEIRN